VKQKLVILIAREGWPRPPQTPAPHCKRLYPQ
jgi:hypothetical protein